MKLLSGEWDTNLNENWSFPAYFPDISKKMGGNMIMHLGALFFIAFLRVHFAKLLLF